MKQQRNRMWELKQSAQPGTLDMYIYSDVQADYFDWWNWEMIESETSANYFRETLASYPDIGQINIYINSYGGSVLEGMAIYNQLRRHPAQKTVYIDGFACSVASVIAMAGDKVIMPSNTMMMIHEISQGVFGNATQLRKAADDLDTIMVGNRQFYLQKSNGKIDEENLIELLRNETWLTAAQCIQYGFADELLEQEIDLTNAQQMLQKVNQTLQQQVSYHKALVAQFRDINQQHKPASPPEVKPPEPKPELKQNNPSKLLASLFR